MKIGFEQGKGKRCLRVAAGPYRPHSQITQLRPSLTWNRCTWSITFVCSVFGYIAPSATHNWCLLFSILGICPKGYYSIAENLDGAGKTWVQPHPDPTRTLLDCAEICNDTTGCTSFEYAKGPDDHGACGWYNGGDSNIKANENRTQANSNWYSCMKE